MLVIIVFDYNRCGTPYKAIKEILLRNRCNTIPLNGIQTHLAVWVTDVTEFSLFGEKLYLSPILDLHSGDLVSYTISDRPVLSMVTTMLNEAFAKIPDRTNLVLHSDQGWQYQHRQYQRMLREKGIRQSMRRKGNCLDNAVIENFFGLLKSELLYLQEFQSMEHFKQELVEYLDYYNNRRIKTKLKDLPPAIHRQQALSAA